MKKLLTPLLMFAAGTVSAQTQDLTMYITPDYGGCSGSIEFQYCDMTTFSIMLDGSPVTSPSSSSFSGLCSGAHSLSFSGSNSLGDVYSFNASLDLSPASPSVSISGASPVAPLTAIFRKMSASMGMCNGMAVLEVANGSAPYAIQWYDNTATPIAGANNDTLNSLCPGMIGFQVTDAYSGGCAGTGSPIMRSIDNLACMISTTPVSCTDLCDGTAIITVMGPTQITFTNLTGPTQTNPIMLGAECAGTVMGIAMDVTGQTTFCYGDIEGEIELVIDSAKSASAAGVNDGAIYYTVTGVSSYTVTWTSAAGSGTGTASAATNLLAGEYEIKVSTSPTCSVRDSATVQMITGAAEPEKQQVKVYPNPFNSRLYIEAVGIKSISIANVAGQKVKSFENFISNNIDLSFLHDGTYILTVELKTGEVLKQQIIKSAK